MNKPKTIYIAKNRGCKPEILESVCAALTAAGFGVINPKPCHDIDHTNLLKYATDHIDLAEFVYFMEGEDDLQSIYETVLAREHNKTILKYPDLMP